MHDPYDLQRFLDAQRDSYAQALSELLDGHKRSHWMWFIFPQLAGLGHSVLARRYALSGIDEAAAFLAHPVLGPRLQQCTLAVLGHPQRSARQIFGQPDDLKLRSCMTLFDQVAPRPSVYGQVLEVLFNGEPDPATLSRLARRQEAKQQKTS